MVSHLNGEVSAAGLAAEHADADLIILDNFDDNLARESGRWTVRDPALAARLSGWTGKLLITCRHAFSLGEPTGPPGLARLAFRRLGPLTAPALPSSTLHCPRSGCSATSSTTRCGG